jgi:dipeptidyl aminopeptidase/acylaminoacyl peptidase
MAAKKNKMISSEDLKNFILVSDARISPDADKIVFCRTISADKNKKNRSLWLTNIKTGKSFQFTSGDSDSHPRWSPDGSKIAFIRSVKDAPSQIFVISLDGGEAQALSKLPEGAIADFKWAPDSKSIAFRFREAADDQTKSAAKEREEKGLSQPPIVIERIRYRMDGDGYFNEQRYHLFVLDVETGEHRVVFNKSSEGPGAYSWSSDGKKIALIANMAKEPMFEIFKDRIYELDIKTGKTKLLPGQKDGSLSNLVWSPDGRYIGFTGRLGKVPPWGARNEHLYVCDLKSKKFKCISDKEDYCIAATVIGDVGGAAFGANIVFSPDSKYIYCNFGWHGNRHVSKIPVKGGKFSFLTDGEGAFSLSNISADGKSFAIIKADNTDPGELHTGTLKKNHIELKKLTSFNSGWLKNKDLSKPRSTWIKSPDGNKIQLWEMKPANFKSGRKYPAVLEIHGGPHALYGNCFFHEFQMLAAQGYVVYFSNPRGSKGYGEKHCSAIEGNWGDKDWIDIQAITKHIKKQKHVDNKKLAVMGGSYGGYMTNWTIGHTNEFAAAITDRCVSNMLSMMGTSDFVTLPDAYWPGNWWDKIDDFWRQSPIRYMNKANTPTLIIHSEGDLRCNIEQAEQVFTMLKIHDVPARFVRYPRNTSHGMSRGGPTDLRIHRLEQIRQWLKKWLE